MAKGLGTVGFLGFGNMGSAIASGLIARGVLAPEAVMAHDPDAGRAAQAAGLGARVAATALELAAAADTLVLAVKPQMWREAAAPLAGALKPGARVVSIMAGVSIAAMRSVLGEQARVIRVMPNTPAMVGAGAAGIAPGPGCDADDADAARTMFEAVGVAEIVAEADLDAVTALSGSGPAYFFYLVECLVNAAVTEGLDPAVAEKLAVQTALGAGRLLAESGEPAATLREKVTSKGGTTFAALEAFRGRDFAGTIAQGVRAAAARSRELGA